jgi:hypothetical protein
MPAPGKPAVICQWFSTEDSVIPYTRDSWEMFEGGFDCQDV